MSDVKSYKERFDALKSERANWDRLYQTLGEFVSQVKQNFTSSPNSGEFLTGDIYDSTATFAAYNCASALLGMLWPSTAKQSIEITVPDDVELSTELADWYSKVTERTVRAMDDAGANLALSLDEYMLDQVIFGTSGVGVERGDESKLLFKSYGVKELYVDEGKNGRVDSIYLFFEWTIKRVVDEYGIDAVSKKTAELYKSGKFNNKTKILICMQRRLSPKAEKGVLAMPIESVHIEYDNNHMLKESGFSELPIKVARFRKMAYERYGRSPAMQALSDTRELNVLRESIIIATGKILDMPKGVMDDGLLGGGTIDTTEGAITVFNSSQSLGGGPPVFEIGSPPDLSGAMSRIEDLKNTIAQHFSLDRLIDFNNDTQMTFGEAQIRAQLRNASLSSLFSRQIAELFDPLIGRVMSILFEDGEFGVIKGSDQEAEYKRTGRALEYIPDVIAERIKKDQEIYSVSYKTQASAAQRAQEYGAILDVLGFAIQGMSVDPTLRFRVDLHRGVSEIAGIRSVPVGIIRENDEVAKLKEQEQQSAEGQQMLQQGVEAADIVQKLSSANR